MSQRQLLHQQFLRFQHRGRVQPYSLRAGTLVTSERVGHPQRWKHLEVKHVPERVVHLYSYACVDENSDDRWAYTGIPEIFFYDEDSTREALRELREDVASEPEDSWPPMQLEKIETVPISKESIFALLNDGVGAFVKNFEVIDTID